MKFLKISSENKYFRDVLDLYETAFPVDERRETDDFVRITDEEPKFDVNIFLGENGEFIGFLTCWTWDDFRYGEHFAVKPDMRCGGIGGEALQWFLHSDNRPLVIEVEPPDGEIERRRIDFYRRNGLKMWNDVAYTQPPYTAGRNSVELKLMTYGDIRLAAGDKHVERIRRDVYRIGKK